MIFCGAGSFSHVDVDGDRNDLGTPPVQQPKPRAWKKKPSNSNKNPYSSRGLDKFSEVMSELDAKREKIMSSAAGSDGVSMVRFMYTNSDDWIPIVVRLRDDPSSKGVAAKKSTEKAQPAVVPLPQPEQSSTDSETVKKTEGAEPERKLKKKRFSLAGEECLRKWRPSYNWLVGMMVILVCVIMFGKVFAICCTTVWWHMAPTFLDTQEKERQRLTNKKDYPRIVNNNR